MGPGGNWAGLLYECWLAPLLVLHIGSVEELYVFVTRSVPIRLVFFLLVFPILYHIVCFFPGRYEREHAIEVWWGGGGEGANFISGNAM